jgi:AsmA protein
MRATAMTLSRSLPWIAGVLFAPILLAVLFIAVFGWNWLRTPVERMTFDKTGRELTIRGDISVKFAWPLPRVRAGEVSFANPSWALERQMVTAEAVEVAVDLPQLLRRNIVLPEVSLVRPVVFLEQGEGGRKNWLLDREQRDEDARIRIDRLTLDNGRVGYDDLAQKTSIRSDLSTSGAQGGVSFTAKGQFRGLPLNASGTGGSVLALRDERTPYAIKADLSVGRTVAKVDGTITSLLKFSAVDMRLSLRGESLAQLYTVLGLTFPETRAYKTDGHLIHSEQTWRYEKFSGLVGDSDIAGTFEVVTGGRRPTVKADLVSKVLDIADLGPPIGAKPGSIQVAKSAPPASAQTHVLPDMPFKTDRWDSVDAQVTLKAASLRGAQALPLEGLAVKLNLNDSVLTLDPFEFGFAGGRLNGVISLDGRKLPIEARARVRARKILLSKLLPKVELSQTSIGEINGEFDLSGRGNSVRGILATSSGKVGMVVAGGEISRLMMEKVGLHLWEILEIKVTGDRLVKLRCGVADFEVKDGVMQTDALVFDTEVTTIVGTGSVDLRSETLALTLTPKTKNTSPVALRSPIYIRGSLAKPVVEVDKARVAARGIGAIALGLINPLLALIPLVDAGPGKDSDCGQLVRDARALPHPERQKTGPRT